MCNKALDCYTSTFLNNEASNLNLVALWHTCFVQKILMSIFKKKKKCSRKKKVNNSKHVIRFLNKKDLFPENTIT